MSENFYSIEWLAREKARDADGEAVRRQQLAQTRVQRQPGPGTHLMRYLAKVCAWVGRHLRLRRGVLVAVDGCCRCARCDVRSYLPTKTFDQI